MYAANTAGAAAGAIAAGFWVIPALAVRGTTWIEVALNAGTAVGALWLARGDTLDVERPDQPFVKPATTTSTAAAPSGFVALVFEVAFTRFLALVRRADDLRVSDDGRFVHHRLALRSAAGARLSRRMPRPAYGV